MILKLNLKNNNQYYWIVDNYLYCTDPHLESINMRALPEDYDIDPEAYDFCGKKEVKPCVTNPLDREFKIPGYLEDNLITMVHDTLSKTYFRHTEDITNNNKDEGK